MRASVFAAWCLIIAGGSVLFAVDPKGTAPASGASDRTTPPASRPEEELARPTVMKVGLSAPTAPRAGEVIVPEKSEAADSGQVQPPAIPTGEQLVEAILRSAGDVSGAKGSVPTPSDLNKSLSGDIFPASVKPTRPTMSSDVQSADAPAANAKKLLPEGYIVRDRVGFIKRDRGRFVFVFEDNTGRDAPLTLLPNKNLESALAQSHAASDNVRFRVTGTVTQYQDSNYLLLQMVLIEQDLGRF